ncbi:MAG: hypothetical protein LBC93_01045 [Synergistaceae bacterium]|jgi:hypothetical protein|nr:hypothetical protein [Synergistaceae bacterium]
MQIEGMRDFFSQIAPLNGVIGVQSNSFLSALPALTQQKQSAHDSLFISNIGKKLSLNIRESSSSIEKRKVKLTDSLPPEAQQADKAMAKAIDILKRIQELAIAAQDKKLSDRDRVEMQIEIEDLRANFKAIPWRMRGGSGPKPKKFSMVVDLGNYDYGDYSSVLGRMRERILSGQEWNVREAWCSEDFTRNTYNENGDEVKEIFAKQTWYVVDDRNVLTSHEGKNVNSGRKVSTVREVLEWATPVIVMDAESAAKGVRFLEQQIASIQKWRERLPANLEKFSMEDAIAFLEAITTPGGVHKPSLNDPTHASAFLYSDGIYDYRHVTPRIEKNNGSDINDRQ